MSWRVLCLTVTALVCCCHHYVHGLDTWPAQADVVLVLDSSATVGSADWLNLRTTLASLVQHLTIDPDHIQVGAVTYGDGVHNELFLNEVSDVTQLVSRLQGITFRGGTADAADAIQFAYQTSFSQQHGSRLDVPHIIVHISDGPSGNSSALLQETQNAHNAGVTIFNVGVGEGVQLDQLAKVASDPSSRYVLQADTYSSLNNLAPVLASRIQNEIPVSSQVLPQTGSCLRKADVSLLVDSSSSVGQQDFDYLDDFIKGLVAQLPIGPDQVQLGLVQFSGHPSLEFPLNLYTERMAVLKAVDSLQFMGGGTNTGDALRYLVNNIYTPHGGARTGVPRVAVVITDGQSVNAAKTAAAAQYARDHDIALIAVGVGESIKESELQAIASDPDSQYVFKVANYRALNNITDTILQAACTLNSMVTPKPTMPSGSVTTQEPCEDKLDNCDEYTTSTCVDYEPWARDNCLKRCGFCQSKEEVTCEDKAKNCATLGSDVCSPSKDLQWAQENCKRFCGFCDSSAITLGFYGKCLYKGREYVQSEKWQDGCDYDCVCENAVRGQYRCYNKCPVYHDLPQECTLVGTPGHCCLRPVCDFNQKLVVQQVAAGAFFNAHNIPMCQYQGRQYFQGQTWEMGCDLKCICTNATLGAYRCQSYCPTYPSLPKECRLVQRAGRCCQDPVCEFNTQTGSFTGFGTLSGRGVGTSHQSGPVCEDAVVDCASHGQSMCADYPDWASVNCAKFCRLCATDLVTAGPNDVCYYNGERYKEGDTWKVGCDTECLCEDAVYGYYRCYSSCPSYLNLPSTCTVTHQTGSCCDTVQCATGTFYPSSINIFSVGNGGGLRVMDPSGHTVEAVPTLPSGATLPPGTYGGSIGLGNIRLDGCLFNGRMFLQDQQWHDGCRHTCTCQDAGIGHFACRERCPKYNDVPASCGTKPDPNDPCCTMPDCPAALGFVSIPVYGKGVQSIGAVQTPSLPSLVSGMFTARFTLKAQGFTVPPPTSPSGDLRPGGLDHCAYKGQHYSHGQRWEDGCQYNCICEDAATGSWRCIDKCEKYVDLPKPYCYLEQDPINPCCQRPVCNFLIVHGQIAGNDTLSTTVSTTPGYSEPQCVYKGVQYAVGQTWYDDCSLRCKCDDADRNLYTCFTRCPAYTDDYSSCPRRPDPEDPTCCMVPACTPTVPPYVTPYPGATLPPTRTPPVIAVIPPGVVTGGNTTGFCRYNGVQYKQGDTWDDGCDLTCVCQDAQNGVYQCTEKCERFGALPSFCHLVSDFANPCCQIPSCSGTGVVINGTAVLPGQSTPAPTSMCVYKKAVYHQGQVWQDGCTKVCRCEDATNALYTCTDRCRTYDLPPQCTLVTDPLDSCCLTPKCQPAVITGSTLAPNPSLIPTLAPGKVVGTAVFPTPTPGPGGETPGINYCIYKGVPYGKGQVWQDGCDFRCVCVDPSAGRYECTERCTRYLAIPPGCLMVKDASDPCCQRPVCSPDLVTPGPKVTLVPGGGSTVTPQIGSTVTPGIAGSTAAAVTPLPKDVCVYKGKYYTDGQTWYDDCDYICTCEDAHQGIYRCIQRCPTYPILPPECYMTSDPNDPLCCQRPLCQFQTTANHTQGYLKPPLGPGVLTGGSVTPTPLPYLVPEGSTLEPPQRPEIKSVCIYKGQEYTQGQKWADDCYYDCECTDAVTGQYRCTEKCLLYAAIPEQCEMVIDPNNPCCKVPYCNTKGVSTPKPPLTHTPIAGSTRIPFIGPDGSTLKPPVIKTPPTPAGRCLYNGVPYETGESWEDGCDLKCVCEDGKSNIYRCDQRCSTYQLPPNCLLVTDPRDSCCRVPSCTPVTPTTAAPVTGPDGRTLYPPTMGPTLGPHAHPTRPPLLIPTGVPGTHIGTVNNPNRNSNTTEAIGCLYKGVLYSEGERWDDGCAGKCLCLNGSAGVYQCKDRCVAYLNVPPTCQLVVDPVDPCCKTALCRPGSTQTSGGTVTPTAGPTATPVSGQTVVTPDPGVTRTPTGVTQTPAGVTGTPTPGPGVTVTPSSGGFITPAANKMCVYKGQYYVEQQQWYDGCDKLCVCEDAQTNYYTCSDRCAKYSHVPSTCQLVASPEDPECCQVPQCVPTPGPHGYPTPTANSGVSPGPTVFTNPPGVVTGRAPFPSPVPGQPLLGYREACLYNGRTYHEGQQWQDGCDYNCVCLNQTTGYYRCQQRCPIFPLVPSQCLLVTDPSDFCCKQLQCDFQQPTPNPFSPSPSPTRRPDPNLHTTVAPSSGPVTPAGGSIPTPSYQPPTIAPQFTFCVYKGITYRQSESWNIGCDQICTCDDSTKNYYTCADRCPSYPKLPEGCVMRVDDRDPCCQVPECYTRPTASPNVPPGMSTRVPLVLPTGVPGVIIGMPNTGTSTVERGCLRNKALYHPGDTWREGCQYDCECLDTSGKYKCTERCTPYPNIPDYCVMMPDPSDTCCTKPLCPDPYQSTPAPLSTLTPPTIPPPGVSTPTPSGVSPQPVTPGYPVSRDVCVYKGSSYTEGQRWYDGCDKVCVCEVGATGFYRCSDRCATYVDAANCKLVPDMNDPSCCKIPECDTPDILNVTGHVGVITGFGKPPVGTPGQQVTNVPGVFVTQTPAKNVCVYNGRAYAQDQMWQDGCDYNCVCVNSTLGQYRCMDRCLQYPQNIAPFCTMLRNPVDPCCFTPKCDTTPTLQPPGETTLAPAFPTLHPVIVPGKEFCVYKGIPYTHGQTWNDGCDKTCRCEDVVTGQINCDDRCPMYGSVASGCRLVTDPRDVCCQVPDCSPLQPPTLNTSITITGPTGVISGNSLPPNHQGPLTRNNVCIYHGREYRQGEVWDDGCAYTCECIDSREGKYLCTERCQRFVNMPPTCTMIQDPSDSCCESPYCLPWPPKEPTPEPGAVPTLAPGVSFTAPPGFTGLSSACFYKGEAYHQGQLWYDDCNAVCRCEDAAVGFYRCQERCRRFSFDPSCIMVPDPEDPNCCQVPRCPLVTKAPHAGVTPTPGLLQINTIPPGVIVGYGKVPTPLPTSAPTGAFGSTITPTPVTGPDGSTIIPTRPPTTGCYYKGLTYRLTEKWEDGCDYVCQCLNGNTGKYTCSDKCPVLPAIPEDRCVLVQDPEEPCCMTPSCDFVNPTPFPDGRPTSFPGVTGVSTRTPGTVTGTPSSVVTPGPGNVITGMCVYKGAYYKQGDPWDDGCEAYCVCENGATGTYTCTSRCKSFGQLPEGCELRVDPNDSCCLVPFCQPPEYTPPTSLPGVTGVSGSSTPAPSYILVGTLKGSFTGTSGRRRPPTGNFGSSTGFTNGCVYKQTLYSQNQVWEDGCDYICACIDALRGKYQCTDRCVSFYFLPPMCKMEQDPSDACCQRARCFPNGFITPPPIPTGTPTPTGTAAAISVTPKPPSGFTGDKSTLKPTGVATNFTGTGTPISVKPDTPTGFTGTGVVINGTQPSFTGRERACVYKDTIYHQGDTWDDGCDLRCECKDDVVGLYMCTYRCLAYSSLPKFCHLQPDPTNICCKKPVCTVQGTQLVPQIGGTPTRSPTLEPSVMNVIPLGTHTIISGSSRPPGTALQTIYGGRSSCVYKGVEHIPGEWWDDGCDYTCQCIGENNGLYRCTSKCPSYSAMPYYCTLNSIPGICCPSLSCEVPQVGPYNPLSQIQPGVKPTPNVNGVYPTPQPTLDPQLILGPELGNLTGTGLPGGGYLVPSGYRQNLGGITDKCIYDLKLYNQGETWNTGCDNNCCNYTCICLDSRTGFYQCHERCATYDLSFFPHACKLVKNGDDQCCSTPSCPDPTRPGQQISNITVIQTLYPIVGSFTGGTSGFRPGYIPTGNFGVIGGTRDGCVYKQSLYSEGARWEDGCDSDCTCVDGTMGMYQCTAKCLTYSALPPMCKLVDVDGECCPKIQCHAATQPPAGECRDKIDNCYQYRHDGCVGPYEGWAREHCPLFCGYCQPDHTTSLPCEDAIPNCENYGGQELCSNKPYEDWVFKNCRKFCNRCGTTTVATTVWTTPESGCYDAIPYCQVYQDVCTDPMYKNWVLDNCRKFCGICGTTVAGVTTPEPCEDLKDNCELYGHSKCGGQYFGWARYNCRKFCGLCGQSSQSVVATTHTTQPPCEDKLSNCDAYSKDYCEGKYLPWAADNCPSYCNLCNYEVTTLQVVRQPGWLVLMKGVARVPGDLWELWSTTATANEKVPQAEYLTNQYLGHYKPPIANQWQLCQFEKVKVAILSQGEEKANIIFDVRNSGKNDWFRLENVISSTFTDLPTSADSFNMARNSSSGHEFTVGQFQKCHGSAWFMVSTTEECQYQKTGLAPQFYYSLSGNAAATIPGQLGVGEVLAILGQGGNCMSGVLTTLGTFTGANEGCFYKGKTYSQGDTWLDGCQLNCTCQDTSTGQYFCVEQCPTFKDLPQECTLEKKPGECCAELKCPYPTGEGCYYKNQTYVQGSTWQDGCDYDCTCDDGSTGSYNCVGICQDWSSLPDVCHMEQPAAGMCCPHPVCPDPIHVDFTPR